MRGFVEPDSVRFSFAFAIMAEKHRLGIGGLRESSSTRWRGLGPVRSQVPKSGKMFPVPCVWRSSCRCACLGAPWLDRIAAAGARSRGWASPKRRFCASSWKTNGRTPESPAEGAVGALGARRTPPQLTRPMLPMGVGSPCAGARNENGAGAAPLTIPGWAMRDVGRAGRGLPLRALRALARFAGRCSRISQAPRPQRGSNPCAGGTKRKRCRGGTVEHSGVGDEGFEPPALCV